MFREMWTIATGGYPQFVGQTGPRFQPDAPLATRKQLSVFKPRLGEPSTGIDLARASFEA